jgi:inner membrane protein
MLLPVPLALYATVRHLDALDSECFSFVQFAALDESAHVCTSLLVLLALFGPDRLLGHPAETATAVASSVLIDLDHLPLYVEDFPIDVSVDGGRPFTHSLSTVFGLGTAAAAVKWRRRLLGCVAGGVAMHFVRDVATGTGLPAWWPFEHRSRSVPYSWYRRTLLALAAVGTARIWQDAQR